MCLDLGFMPGVLMFEYLPPLLSSFTDFVVEMFLLESILFGKFPWPLGFQLEGKH